MSIRLPLALGLVLLLSCVGSPSTLSCPAGTVEVDGACREPCVTDSTCGAGAHCSTDGYCLPGAAGDSDPGDPGPGADTDTSDGGDAAAGDETEGDTGVAEASCNDGVDNDDADLLVDYCDVADCTCAAGARLGCATCGHCSVSATDVIVGQAVTLTFNVDDGSQAGACTFIHGDGTSNTAGCNDGRTGTHAFTASGTFTVRMTEYQNDGVDDQLTCGTILVRDPESSCTDGVDNNDVDTLVDYCDTADCTCAAGARLGCATCAHCTVSATNVTVGQEITFTLFVDAGSQAGACTFAYGDGSNNTGGCTNGRTATRSYSAAGTYEARVTEYQTDGVDDAVACGTIVVN